MCLESVDYMAFKKLRGTVMVWKENIKHCSTYSVGMTWMRVLESKWGQWVGKALTDHFLGRGETGQLAVVGLKGLWGTHTHSRNKETICPSAIRRRRPRQSLGPTAFAEGKSLDRKVVDMLSPSFRKKAEAEILIDLKEWEPWSYTLWTTILPVS